MKTSFWTRLFDLISPRACAICGQRLSPNESVLCAKCHLHLPLTGFQKQASDNPMARIFWGQIPIERAAALFYYQAGAGPSQLIYDMKYHNCPELAESMGEITASLFGNEGFFDTIDAIVPVPLTRRRRWQRGYNQSHQIAQGIATKTSLPIYNKVLKRISFSGSQTTMNAWQRQSNVEAAFKLVDAEKIRGKHLLIVDDIVTTGATVIACGRELVKTEGVRISVLSLGYTK